MPTYIGKASDANILQYSDDEQNNSNYFYYFCNDLICNALHPFRHPYPQQSHTRSNDICRKLHQP